MISLRTHPGSKRRAWGLLALTLLVLVAPAPGDAKQPPAGPLPKGPLVFVSNVLDHSVTVVEPALNKYTRVPVGALPHNFSLSPDGKQAVVINTGSESVSFFDARTGKFERTMLVAPIPKNKPHDKLGPKKFVGKTSCHQCHGPNAVGRLPSGAIYTPDGKGLWTIPFNPGGLVLVDKETGKQLREMKLAAMPFETQPSNVIFTPDGKEMIVVHRRAGKTELPKGEGPQGPKNSMGFDHGPIGGILRSLVTFHTPDGKTQTGSLVVPENLPYKADFSADGKTMYLAYRSTNKVAEIDVPTRTLKRMLIVGEGPTNAIVDKKDGKWLYAPSFYDSPADISKLEIATGKVRALLPAKTSPTIIDQDKDSGRIYAVINAGNRILEIDPSGKGKITKEWPTGAFPLDILVVPESARRKAWGR